MCRRILQTASRRSFAALIALTLEGPDLVPDVDKHVSIFDEFVLPGQGPVTRHNDRVVPGGGYIYIGRTDHTVYSAPHLTVDECRCPKPD